MAVTLLRLPTLALILLLSAFSAGQQSPPPDLLLFNAHVITMDRNQPSAQAIAIRQDRIAWVGSKDDARKLFGENVRIVDLHGATVLPGIIDAHTHLAELGKS